MNVWVPILSAFAGGLLAIGAATIAQILTGRREREARAWNRRADVYMTLLRWRLDPPDDERIADPYELQEATDAWKTMCRPIFAELALFGGPRIRHLLALDDHPWHSIGRLGAMGADELSKLAADDLAEIRRRPRKLRLRRHEAALL